MEGVDTEHDVCPIKYSWIVCRPCFNSSDFVSLSCYIVIQKDVLLTVPYSGPITSFTGAKTGSCDVASVVRWRDIHASGAAVGFGPTRHTTDPCFSGGGGGSSISVSCGGSRPSTSALWRASLLSATECRANERQVRDERRQRAESSITLQRNCWRLSHPVDWVAVLYWTMFVTSLVDRQRIE